MSKFQPTIGLEIHAELKTETKMFCACKNDPDEVRPNVNVCPICMGHPGTLPVINERAVESVLRVGKAVGGKLVDKTEFDRKNYFYPDIPKGYQISQYKHPLVAGGELAGVMLTRIHLEEDTGTSIHDKGDYSLVNYNRAGVPLMELVTEPVISSSREASNFAKELQLLLQYLGVADANMEKGQMRIEANVSILRGDLGGTGSKGLPLGTKVEVKNINSFRAVEKTIEYEVERQPKLLEAGEKVIQETRGWDEKRQETFSQRAKESSHDYRYFPDPDLPKLQLGEGIELGDLPETPAGKRERFKEAYSLKESDIEFYISNRELADFFEQVANKEDKSFNQLASNYIVSDLSAMEEKYRDIEPSSFVGLIIMIEKNLISSRGAKEILSKLENGKTPEEIARENNLLQESDVGEIRKVVERVIESNSKIVSEYKSGKVATLQYLIGQGMKKSVGRANPQMLKELFTLLLDDGQKAS